MTTPRFRVIVVFEDTKNMLASSDEARFDVPQGCTLEDIAQEYLRCLGVGLREEIRRQRALGAPL